MFHSWARKCSNNLRTEEDRFLSFRFARLILLSFDAFQGRCSSKIVWNRWGEKIGGEASVSRQDGEREHLIRRETKFSRSRGGGRGAGKSDFVRREIRFRCKSATCRRSFRRSFSWIMRELATKDKNLAALAADRKSIARTEKNIIFAFWSRYRTQKEREGGGKRS